jgi:hypothetical protein
LKALRGRRDDLRIADICKAVPGLGEERPGVLQPHAEAFQRLGSKAVTGTWRIGEKQEGGGILIDG